MYKYHITFVHDWGLETEDNEVLTNVKTEKQLGKFILRHGFEFYETLEDGSSLYTNGHNQALIVSEN